MPLDEKQKAVFAERFARKMLKDAGLLTTAVSAAVDKAKADKDNGKPPKGGK